jgi:hypothetical protein
LEIIHSLWNKLQAIGKIVKFFGKRCCWFCDRNPFQHSMKVLTDCNVLSINAHANV